MLIDTHAHLFWKSFEEDLEQVVARARQAGVERVIVPAVDQTSARKSIAIARQYPDWIRVAIGIHPREKVAETRTERERCERLIEQHRKWVVAVGEIGLDWKEKEAEETRREQEKRFREMVEMAKEKELPLIIHSRGKEVVAKVLEILSEIGWHEGVMHCFSGNREELEEVVKRGLKVSFCGNISWSQRVRRLVRLVPKERLLLETDSPFMVPRDKAGKPVGGSLRNEPKNVRMLAEIYAALRGERVETIAAYTRENARRLFKL